MRRGDSERGNKWRVRKETERGVGGEREGNGWRGMENGRWRGRQRGQ